MLSHERTDYLTYGRKHQSEQSDNDETKDPDRRLYHRFDDAAWVSTKPADEDQDDEAEKKEASESFPKWCSHVVNPHKSVADNGYLETPGFLSFTHVVVMSHPEACTSCSQERVIRAACHVAGSW